MAATVLSPLRPLLFRLVAQTARHWWGVLILWCLFALPAWAELELRVAIRNGVDEVTVGSSTDAVIRDSAGNALAQLPGGRSLIVESSSSGVEFDNRRSSAVWVEPNNDGYVFIGDRWYRGRVLLTPTQGGLAAINYVDLEEYLYSVLGGEMPSSWPAQALQAQAVAARSYALFQRQQSGNSLFDLGTSTSWQVYRGLETEAPSTRSAVEATRGQVLTYNGQIIQAVFHSSSGGHTENVEDVWVQPLPYLRGVQDYDAGAPVFEWSVALSMQDFDRRIPGVGTLISAVPEETTPLGRVVSMRFQGNGGTRVLKGSDIRSALGLKSTLFNISVSGNTVYVTGRGFGHGIGLSQWGAHNLAAQGYSYQQILSHYYQGVVLSQIQVQ